MESIVLGGGCFWCLDALYKQVKGVESVLVGYAGGDNPNPTYHSSHTDGHAEVAKIEFDPSVISLDTILEIFWHIHDPTTLNRQGHDVGPAYRSIILASSDEQLAAAQASLADVGQPLWDDPIVTEVKRLEQFHEAEDFHQDYFNKNPEQGYCQVVINPKLAKFNAHFPELLK